MQIIRRVIVFILTWEARAVLLRYKPKVIAITGSVGKTSTKDAIFAAISKSAHVRKSEKSFNSELGVPLTILGCETGWKNPLKWSLNILKGLYVLLVRQPYPEWLVLEVGADRPGDIRGIAKWLKPDIAVLTAVPEVPVHVEFFDSPEAVFREKRALAEHVKPGGKIVLNGDQERMKIIRTEFRGASFTFGLDKHNDFAASHIGIEYAEGKPSGMHFRLERGGSSVPVAVYGALGLPRIYASLAALAVCESVGVDIVSGARELGGWAPPPGRMRLIPGAKDSLIIDDTYNSSPAAALSALDALKEAKHMHRKIAVLGDMMELGRYSSESHREVGRHAAHCTDLLITVGIRARAIAEAALEAGMSEAYVFRYEQDESARAGRELASVIAKNDLVLVKGSQSMRMERTVKAIMAEPARAKELLVRQDAEWQNR